MRAATTHSLRLIIGPRSPSSLASGSSASRRRLFSPPLPPSASGQVQIFRHDLPAISEGTGKNAFLVAEKIPEAQEGLGLLRVPTQKPAERSPQPRHQISHQERCPEEESGH